MRASGILMPIFSLSSNYGIGSFGKEAYEFVDFLEKAGQTYWQILPISITGFGDSPYQSTSSYAGNPYFIDLDMLIQDGYLTRSYVESINWGEEVNKVNYEVMYQNRYKVLRKAYTVFKCNKPADYNDFERKNKYWLEDYALYYAIKNHHGGKSFDLWEEGLKKRIPKYIKKAKTEFFDDIEFYKMIQYFFCSQWFALKKYANSKGIYIIGDIPIYVALDSADVWSEPKQFLLDDNLRPTAMAGCPPDAFSDNGQLWGNPLYDWEYMEKQDFKWWVRRLKYASKLYDFVRIDHFRAFSAYYSIPFGEKTAVNGQWVKGPDKILFDVFIKKLGKLNNIIAEDLGTIDDEVRELLKYTGFPGMKVLQFAFNPKSESSYLPHNIEPNSVVYTGTHDNDTLIGYMKDAPKEEVKFMCDYLRISENESFNWSVIKAAMATNANTVIFQMQDFLGLDNFARTNTPATDVGNWQWRIEKGSVNDWLAGIIRENTKLYFRLPVKCAKRE